MVRKLILQVVAVSHLASSDVLRKTTKVAESVKLDLSIVSSTLQMISVDEVDSTKQSVLPTPPL